MSTDDIFRCGRPTKAGTPCKHRLTPRYSTSDLGDDPELLTRIRTMTGTPSCAAHIVPYDAQVVAGEKLISDVIRAARNHMKERERIYTEERIEREVQRRLAQALLEHGITPDSPTPAPAAPAKPRRTHDYRGRQIVEANGYAYTWDGAEPLQMGDLVEVPGNWLIKQVQQFTVTNLGTDYPGELASVIRLVSRA